ncbi:MAG TPA: hypothetical protein VLH84_01125 [Patescibacteria group bacterium]|nr:hypothetical protein [Patescibacteria group bacterium]
MADATELLGRAHERAEQLRGDPDCVPRLIAQRQPELNELYASLVTVAVNLGRLLGAQNRPKVRVYPIELGECDATGEPVMLLGEERVAAAYPFAERYTRMMGPQVSWRAGRATPDTVGKPQPARLEQLMVDAAGGLLHVAGDLAGNLPDRFAIASELPEPWQLHGGLIGIVSPDVRPISGADFERRTGVYATDGPVLSRHPVDLAVGVIGLAHAYQISDQQLAAPLNA